MSVLLGDICNVATGQSAPQDKTAFSNEGVPFIRAGSLQGLLSGKKEDDFELISEVNAEKYRMKLFPKHTVVFAKSGMSAKIGRVYRLQKPCYLVSHLAAVLPSDKIDSGYLQRWFEKNPPSRLIENNAYPSIKTSVIQQVAIPLPLLEEQKRIAVILDKADTIRRKRQEAITLADDFLRATFLNMFGDPVTNPKGWKITVLKNIGYITTGNTPSRKVAKYFGNDIEWIKSNNINTPYHFLTKAEESLSKEGGEVGRKVAPYSTLVTCIAGSFDCIGNTALSDREVAFNQQINAITPKEDIDPFFLYCLILNAKKMIQGASTNSMKGMISKGKFEQILVYNPPTSLQQKFGSFFQTQMENVSKIRMSKKYSDNLFNSLAQQAFQGKL